MRRDWAVYCRKKVRIPSEFYTLSTAVAADILSRIRVNKSARLRGQVVSPAAAGMCWPIAPGRDRQAFAWLMRFGMVGPLTTDAPHAKLLPCTSARRREQCRGPNPSGLRQCAASRGASGRARLAGRHRRQRCGLLEEGRGVPSRDSRLGRFHHSHSGESAAVSGVRLSGRDNRGTGGVRAASCSHRQARAQTDRSRRGQRSAAADLQQRRGSASTGPAKGPRVEHGVGTHGWASLWISGAADIAGQPRRLGR